MNKNKVKNELRIRRHNRVRAKVSGSAVKPRLSVSRSLKHIYVQLINDEIGQTLVSARDTEAKGGKNKTEKAHLVGKLVGEKAVAKGVKQAVFDKGANSFHGRIKAVADGAREAGLKI